MEEQQSETLITCKQITQFYNSCINCNYFAEAGTWTKSFGAAEERIGVEIRQ